MLMRSHLFACLFVAVGRERLFVFVSVNLLKAQ